MIDAEKPRLAQLLGNVMSYYGKSVTPFLLDVWWQACQRFSFEQVDRALRTHIAHPDQGQFPPKIADLVRFLSGTGTDRAVAAWGKVHDAMARVGAWQDVVFDDPVIHVVVNDMGGWPKVARADDKDLSYVQHRFMELYRSIAERGADGYPRVLAGARDTDTEYERRGLPLPAPVLVGDTLACAEVFRGGGEPRVALTFLRPGDVTGELMRLPGGFEVKALAAPKNGGGDAHAR